MTRFCTRCDQEIPEGTEFNSVPVDPFNANGPGTGEFFHYHKVCPRDLEQRIEHVPMSGHELLQILRGMSDEDLSRAVLSEGCDCYGPAVGLTIDEDSIVVARSHADRTPKSEGLR